MAFWELLRSLTGRNGVGVCQVPHEHGPALPFQAGHWPVLKFRWSVAGSHRVLISGIGLCTPLGFSAWQTFRALIAGRTLGERAAAIESELGPVERVRAVGCVSNVQHCPVDPAVMLAEQVARQALSMATRKPEDVPCLLATSKGAMGALSEAYDLAERLGRGSKVMAEGPTRLIQAAAHARVLGPHGYIAYELQRRLGLITTKTVTSACASGLTALHMARLALIENPDLDHILVLSTESSLLPLFIHSYRRLGVLAPLTSTDYRGLPLDRRRRGFTLAEQAAAVLLSRVSKIDNGQIELVDTAIGSSGYDLVRADPGMAAHRKLTRELLAGRAIDLIHPHAPGTLEHDAHEMAVYDAVVNSSQRPSIYACKGAIGHGLGAAGLVALVIAYMCAKTGHRPPMPWLSDPIDSRLLLARTGASGRGAFSNQMVFAAGFGGHLAGAVIRCRNRMTDA